MGDYFNTPCATVYAAGDVAWGTACLAQRFVQVNSSVNVYVGDSITTTAESLGGSTYLYEALGNDIYNYGGSAGTHAIFTWQPDSTAPITTNGTSVTESVTYNGFGVSATENVYKDLLSPWLLYFANGGWNQFGDEWTGCEPFNTSVGAPAADDMHVTGRTGYRITVTADVSITIGWTTGC